MKKIILVGILTLTVSILPSNAQQFSMDTFAPQTLEIIINQTGGAHVIHNVNKHVEIKEVPIISKSFSNLVVIDEEGQEPQHALITDNDASITVFPVQENYIVEYDIDDALSLKKGIWRWDFLYIATTTFIFPENVNLVFVNERPVKLDDRRGIVCHGCQVKIEYITNEPIFFEKIQWEEKNFQVGFRTLADITSFNFNQTNKSISFDVNKEDQIITLLIPLELLWNPYDVYLNDNNILKHEFFNNGTHVWLNLRPDSRGQITIIGISVIPEFPILIPLFLGITAVIILHQKTKFNHC